MYTDHMHDQLGKYRVGVIAEAMPDFVKEAEEKIVSEDLTKLADGAFAYSDGLNRYFPIHNKEHTWLSHAYFEKFAEQIPEQDRESVKARISDACEAFSLPEENMVKSASVSNEDEIDELHSLLIEMNKFVTNYKRLNIEERRQVAKHLLHQAYALGKQSNIHDVIKTYAGDGLNKDYPHAFAKRMAYFGDHSPERELLSKMQEETPTCPEKAARALAKFDSNTSLDRLYDNELDDPYRGILNPHVPEDMMEMDGCKLLPSKVKNFDYSSLSEIISDALMEAFKANPIEALQNVKPHVRMIIVKRMEG